MLLDDTAVAGFFYLSSIEDEAVIEKEASDLRDKLYIIPESYRQWFSWYLDWESSYDSFPSFDKFKSQAQMENEVSLSFQEAQEVYYKTVAVWESDALAAKLVTVPLAQRRELLLKLSSVLATDTAENVSLSSTSTFSVEGTIIKARKSEEKYCKLFTQHLNNLCIVNPGTTISVIGPPASFKTSVVLNIVYLNSILGSLNSMYIYLENTEAAYNIELLARHSYTNGMLVENATLKRGVDEDEPQAVKVVKDLQRSFLEDKKGEVYFVPFSRFNPEPLRFANQLAKFVREHNIGIVVFDYLQRAKSYTPLKWDRREYINQVMSDFCTCALGSFGCDPFVAVALAQPKREAEERMLKTKGVGMTLYDAAEVSSIERDSFISIGVYADAETKSNQSMVYKILKNRDNSVDVSTVSVAAIPQFCYVGDMANQASSVTYSQEDAMSMLDIGGL
jgi:hypothetical protein